MESVLENIPYLLVGAGPHALVSITTSPRRQKVNYMSRDQGASRQQLEKTCIVWSMHATIHLDPGYYNVESLSKG